MSVENSQLPAGTPDLEAFRLIEFIVRRIPISEIKTIIFKGERNPLISGISVNRQDSIGNAISFAKCYVGLPKIVADPIPYLPASPFASPRAWAGPEIKEDVSPFNHLGPRNSGIFR